MMLDGDSENKLILYGTAQSGIKAVRPYAENLSLDFDHDAQVVVT